MPSTFLGLNTAYSGLVTYQAAINVTGNNMSNVETKGYTRQVASRTASQAISTNTTYGMIGTGVSTIGITQIRDYYYDMKFRANNSMYGEYEIKSYYMAQIENYFLDSKDLGISGFNTLFDDMFSTLNNVKNNASDESVRNQFIQSAQALTEYFNTLSNNMLMLQKDCNTEIKNKVDQVNAISQKLAALNKQINVIELGGSIANELRDERNLLIDELSKIGPVEITETPIYNTNYPNMSTGANNYTVSFYGYTLVSTNDYNTLQVNAREHKVNQTDADGLYDISWSNGLEFNMSSNQNGELSALLQMRDGNNGENFTGKVASYTTNATNITSLTVSVTGNTYTDVSRCNLNKTGTVKIGNMEVEYSDFTINTDGTYTFTLASDSNLLNTVDITSMNCSVGESINYMGVPYYMSQMNEFVRSFAKAFNDIHITGQDLDGNNAGLFFVSIGEEATLTEEDYYQITAGNIKVSKALLENARLMATTVDSSQGVGNNDLVDQLLKVKTDKNLVSFRGGSASDFLKCLVSDISLNAKSANTFSKNYQNIGNVIANQRLSISGVDNEEEGVSLIRFQHAYNLCSKMVQVLSEIYDRLILQTGV